MLIGLVPPCVRFQIALAYYARAGNQRNPGEESVPRPPDVPRRGRMGEARRGVYPYFPLFAKKTKNNKKH